MAKSSVWFICFSKSLPKELSLASIGSSDLDEHFEVKSIKILSQILYHQGFAAGSVVTSETNVLFCIFLEQDKVKGEKNPTPMAAQSNNVL